MRLKDSVWQGDFGYWQTGYIHTNLLMIGSLAWSGFLKLGRGFVVCTVDEAAIAASTNPLALSPFTAQFIPVAQLSVALALANLTETPRTCEPTAIPAGIPVESFDTVSRIAALQDQANVYDPNRDVMILLIANGRVEASLLHNLAIAPLECHQQVRDRWDEFQPCFTSSQEQ